jgi:hypothetical protein
MSPSSCIRFLAEFVSFDDLRILITHVVSSNSSYIELALKHPTKRVGLVQNKQHYQDSTCRHVAQVRHVILTQIHPVCVLISYCCLISREATNNYFCSVCFCGKYKRTTLFWNNLHQARSKLND